MEWETTDELLIKIANRIKRIRKYKKVTQEDLSKMSNVSYGSIKRFENTGEISFRSLIKICKSLEIDNDIRDLFSNNIYKDINEAIRDGRMH